MAYHFPRRRGAALIAAVATAAMLLTGCAGSAAPETGDDGELTAITVATLPIADFAPVYIGIEQGFFEEEGLEVTTEVVQSGSDAITGALGGTFDFFGVGYVPIFTAIGQGLPVRVVSANDNGGLTEETDWLGVMVNGDSSIAGPEDLAGKAVAVNALKGVLEITLRAALESEGIDSSTVEFTEIPFPEMPAALAEGKVDAIFATEPFLTPSLEAGGKIVFSPYTTLSPAFPNASWGGTNAMIDSDPETVAAFVRAIQRSIQFAADNPDVLREVIPTFTRVTPEVADVMRLPDFNPEYDFDALHDLLEYTQKYGTLTDIPSDDVLFYQL